MTDVAQSFAATFVDELAAQGVEFACVSPGSRSAPIAMALQRHPRIKVLVHIDERCGSFFAVGLGKATGKPAVVLSTSGTAAAEFHAAVVEASYSRTPLIVAGELREGERLAPALKRLGLPVLAEPTSQLRRAETGAAVECYEALLRAGWSLQHGPDLVLRLGATPTSRVLNRWLAAAAAPTFLVDPDQVWRDQDQVATNVLACEPQPLLEAMPTIDRSAWRDQWVSAGKRAAAAIAATLVSTPLHEGHVVRALAGRVPDPGNVFVGSRQTIRAAICFWPYARPAQRFFANRGASGIDGLVSSGLGVATARNPVPTVLLLGDLSLYHDMNGLWALQRHGIRATLVVCDNNGGGVFNFLPQAEHQDVFEEIFATPLGLDLSQVARLYGLVYSPVSDRSGLEPAIADAIAAPTPTMVVVRFKREDSVNGHRLIWEATASALKG